MPNRIIKLGRDEVTYESDPMHANMVVNMLGIESARAVSTPRVGSPSTQEDTIGNQLSAAETTGYRSCIATINYMAMDRPDIQEAAIMCSKFTSNPHEGDLANLKRLGIYIKGSPILVQSFIHRDTSSLVAYTDSDWAGCRTTRRSVSSGVVVYGSPVKTYSKDQKHLA